MFDGNWKTQVEKAVRPMGESLRRAGVTPDVLTVVGLLLAVTAAVAVGMGALRAGLLLVILAARGAFFDSVADRGSDTMLLGGVPWYLADTHGGLLPLLPMAVLGASLIISYERAKAEALGFNAKGGVMERAERVILLGLGLLFPVLLIPVLWIMLVLTVVTAVQRFAKVWSQASQERAVVAPTRRASRRRAARANRAGSSQWRQNLQARRRR